MKNVEVTKPQNLAIDLLSYVGKYGDNNPNKGIYTKEEVAIVVKDVVNKFNEYYYDLDNSNLFTIVDYALQVMDDYDALASVEEALTNRIYEGLNDMYNPYDNKLWTVRKGLNLKDADDIEELLSDIENEYANYIIEDSGTFDEETDCESTVHLSVKDVIEQIYNKVVECLHIQ